jgi:hypothetical protein
VTMDFITSLPKEQGYDAIFVVVDRFSKQARFAPTTMKMGAEHTAKLFFDYWISQKGYPEHIVSDGDVQFQTAFWQYLMKRAKTRLTLTTSFHPQGDGQTERINAILNMYLRNFIATDHGDWVDLLSEAEFCYNTAHATSIGMSPFKAGHRFDALKPIDLVLARNEDATSNYL